MKIFFTFTCMLYSLLSFAQNNSSSVAEPGRQSFYAELGGPGILFSANYDTRFNKSRTGLGARIGLGFVSGYIVDNNSVYNSNPVSVVTFPLQLNYVFGKPNSVNAFEVGAGITISGRTLEIFNFYEENSSAIFGTASFMYRRIPKDGGFSWRAGFTPIIASGYIQPFAAVSVGYNF
ncbi:MAG: hypothetical protein WD135_03080 [Ferruginibacter sp.]